MPAKLSAPLPPALKMRLRLNCSIVPGAPDMDKAKRSTSVVRAEKEEKEQEKREKKAIQDTKIKMLSQLEEEIKNKDKETDLDANNPPIIENKKRTCIE